MRPNMRPMEKTDLKGALNDLSTYMRKSLGVVVLALVLAALSAVLTIIGPDQVGKIATIMSDGLLGGIDLAAIARVGILLAMRMQSSTRGVLTRSHASRRETCVETCTTRSASCASIMVYLLVLV